MKRNLIKKGGVITFTERRQKFLKTIRTEVALGKPEESRDSDEFLEENYEDYEDYLTAEIEKRFNELFGPIDDD